MKAAGKVIEQAEHLTLSERGSLRVLDALENPPAPAQRLMTLPAAGWHETYGPLPLLDAPLSLLLALATVETALKAAGRL